MPRAATQAHVQDARTPNCQKLSISTLHRMVPITSCSDQVGCRNTRARPASFCYSFGGPGQSGISLNILQNRHSRTDFERKAALRACHGQTGSNRLGYFRTIRSISLLRYPRTAVFRNKRSDVIYDGRENVRILRRGYIGCGRAFRRSEWSNCINQFALQRSRSGVSFATMPPRPMSF
jgi:hypothetical protein